MYKKKPKSYAEMSLDELRVKEIITSMHLERIKKEIKHRTENEYAK